MDDDGNDLSDIEPQGVQYIERLREIAGGLAKVNQHHVLPEDDETLSEVRQCHPWFAVGWQTELTCHALFSLELLFGPGPLACGTDTRFPGARRGTG